MNWFIVGAAIFAIVGLMEHQRSERVRHERCVVVVGGSGGLGAAIVDQYLRRGLADRVVVVSRSKPRRHVEWIQYDILDDGEPPPALLRAYEEATRIYNCVGMARFGDDQETFDTMLALNLRANVRQLRLQATHARPDNQLIITTVDSVLAHDIFLPHYEGYAATKHGLRAYVRTMQLHPRYQHIRFRHYSAGTMSDTPGYAAEQRSKPELTRRLEGGDGVSVEENAKRAMQCRLHSGDWLSRLMVDIMPASLTNGLIRLRIFFM